MPNSEHNQGVQNIDVSRLHTDLTLTNERLKAQQVTLEHILAKLGTMEATLQAFTTSKAVLDERLANEKIRVDELEATVERLARGFDRAETQLRAAWWILGTPLGALLLSALRDHLIGK